MLLQPFSVGGRRTPEKLRTYHLGKDFGKLARTNALPDVDATIETFEKSALSEELLKEWRRCVAEELLLRHSCGLRIPEPWAKTFAADSPFGTGIRLADCLQDQLACAVFPLAGGESAPEPGIGHVWVLKGIDHRELCEGIDSLPSDLGVCFVTDCQSWGDRSWQLAARMAQVVTCGTPGAPTQQDLLDWVFSGAVDEQDHLVRVDGILSKSTFPLPGKQWLLPRENLVDPEFKAIRQRLRMVYTEASLSSSMALVSGHGTRTRDMDETQIVCDEMHALVGGAPEPIIAGFLLAITDRLTLWQTEEKTSRKAGTTVCEVLRGLLPEADIKIETLPSNSVVGAEKTLWEGLAKHPERRIALNATGGNRLMFAAAQSMARFFDNVRLLYRNINADPHHFVELVYRQDNPSEGVLICRPHRATQCRWDILYSNNREKNLDAADILREMTGAQAQSDFPPHQSSKPAPGPPDE